MFKNLLKRFGIFDKGTRIKQISREEFVYKKLDGHSVIVYVFWVTGREGDIDRVLLQSTIKHWVKPNNKEVISDSDQKDIIENFSDYFGASGEVMIVEKKSNNWKNE